VAAAAVKQVQARQPVQVDPAAAVTVQAPQQIHPQMDRSIQDPAAVLHITAEYAPVLTVDPDW
jgi:hypothetical protein